jgi:hypothetical protein
VKLGDVGVDTGRCSVTLYGLAMVKCESTAVKRMDGTCAHAAILQVGEKNEPKDDVNRWMAFRQTKTMSGCLSVSSEPLKLGIVERIYESFTQSELN